MAVDYYNIYISSMEMLARILSLLGMFLKIIMVFRNNTSLLIISRVSKPVKLAFFFHLTHWLLFGTIDDKHSEFFISCKNSGDSSSKMINKSTASSHNNLVIVFFMCEKSKI